MLEGCAPTAAMMARVVPDLCDFERQRSFSTGETMETPNSQHYAWAVKQGLVEVWRESGEIRLRSSDNRPSDATICTLTDEDALEIATLLFHLAQKTPGY